MTSTASTSLWNCMAPNLQTGQSVTVIVNGRSTLGFNVIWDGKAWRNPDTGAAV